MRRRKSDARPASARSDGSTRARSPPRRCRSCSIRACPAGSSATSPARSTAARSRARPASSRTRWASSCSRPEFASSMIRCAGAACARARSTPKVSPARGASSSTTGPTNLHLEPGTVSPEALIADIDEGFYAVDMIGVGVNLVTGDYSRGAAGFWIEKGKLTYPVSGVTIAGHLFEVFRTLHPANDLQFRYGTNAPTVRVEGLTVAGH